MRIYIDIRSHLEWLLRAKKISSFPETRFSLAIIYRKTLTDLTYGSQFSGSFSKITLKPTNQLSPLPDHFQFKKCGDHNFPKQNKNTKKKTPKGSAFENTISIIMPFHATDPWSRVCDGKFDWSIDHGFLEMRHSNEY